MTIELLIKRVLWYVHFFVSLKFEAGRNVDIRNSCGRWLSQVHVIHVIDPCYSLEVHRQLSLWIGPIMERLDSINNTSVSRLSQSPCYHVNCQLLQTTASRKLSELEPSLPWPVTVTCQTSNLLISSEVQKWWLSAEATRELICLETW